MNGTGIMLPIKLSIAACIGDNPNDMPTGIAPRSSIMGNTAVNRTVNSVDNHYLNKLNAWHHCIYLFIVIVQNKFPNSFVEI